jgi:hypothetical protein
MDTMPKFEYPLSLSAKVKFSFSISSDRPLEDSSVKLDGLKTVK